MLTTNEEHKAHNENQINTTNENWVLFTMNRGIHKKFLKSDVLLPESRTKALN